MPNAIPSKLVKNASALSITQIAGSAIRFLYMLVIARLLGPEQTGIYLYGLALYISVIGLCHFGQNIFLAQRIGKRKTPLPAILHHSLALTTSISLAAAVVLSIFVWISEPELYNKIAILCFVGAMLARVIVVWVRLVYISIEKTQWIPRYEVSFRTSEAVFGTLILILMSGEGLMWICFLHMMAWTVEAVFSIFKLNREIPGAINLGSRPRYLKSSIKLSVLYLTTTTALLVFPQISVLLLRNFQHDEQIVGIFGIAMQFFNALMILPMSLTRAFLPRLSREYSQNETSENIMTAAKLMALLGLCLSFLAAAYVPWFMQLTLGSRFYGSAEIFRLLCLALTPFSTAFLLCFALNVLNKNIAANLISVAMVLIHAMSLLYFIKLYPIEGAVYSMIGASILGMILGLVSTLVGLGHGNPWDWVRLLIIFAITFALYISGISPEYILGPTSILIGMMLTWRLRVFNPSEIKTIRGLM